MSKDDPFAELAPIYDTVFPQIVPKYSEALDIMAALVPYPPDAEIRIVELGCGTGEVLLRFARSFPRAEIFGVDVSPAMLDMARKKVGPYMPRVGVERHDLESVGWPSAAPESCHVVVCAYVMDYLSREAQRSVIDAAFEHLESGGVFLSIEFVQPEEPRISQILRDLEYRLISNAVKKGAVKEEQLNILSGISEKGPGRYVTTLRDRLAGLEEAGFQRVDTAWRFLNFVLVTARKS